MSVVRVASCVKSPCCIPPYLVHLPAATAALRSLFDVEVALIKRFLIAFFIVVSIHSGTLFAKPPTIPTPTTPKAPPKIEVFEVKDPFRADAKDMDKGSESRASDLEEQFKKVGNKVVQSVVA